MLDVKRILSIIVVFVYCLNCGAQQIDRSKEYVIEAYSSVDDSFSYLTMKTFDFEYPDNELFVIYRVNNIILNENLVHEKLMSVLSGEFKVNSLFPGKKTKEINLKINKGDSICVTFYLRDDGPLHPDGVSDIVVPKKN